MEASKQTNPKSIYLAGPGLALPSRRHVWAGPASFAVESTVSSSSSWACFSSKFL